MRASAVIGYLLTICISVYGGWQAASEKSNERFYSVENRIQMIEVQKADLKDLQDIKQALIRIEGKLDTKQDKYYEQN